MRNNTVVSNTITVIVAVVFFIVLCALFSYPVMVLWNVYLVPAVSWANEIGWEQAWGLSFLCGMLFRSSSLPVSR